jgi:hypothetical protein
MRDAFAGKVVTMIDERDQETIAAHEEDREDDPESPSMHQVSVNNKVRYSDNFFGISSLKLLQDPASHR